MEFFFAQYIKQNNKKDTFKGLGNFALCFDVLLTDDRPLIAAAGTGWIAGTYNTCSYHSDVWRPFVSAL